MKIKIKSWQNEDEMTEKSMYDALYPLSKVNFVRLFPKEIEVKKSICDTAPFPNCSCKPSRVIIKKDVEVEDDSHKTT